MLKLSLILYYYINAYFRYSNTLYFSLSANVICPIWTISSFLLSHFFRFRNLPIGQIDILILVLLICILENNFNCVINSKMSTKMNRNSFEYKCVKTLIILYSVLTSSLLFRSICSSTTSYKHKWNGIHLNNILLH